MTAPSMQEVIRVVMLAALVNHATDLESWYGTCPVTRRGSWCTPSHNRTFLRGSE